jgi:stage V sporulation protein SpoVS
VPAAAHDRCGQAAAGLGHAHLLLEQAVGPVVAALDAERVGASAHFAAQRVALEAQREARVFDLAQGVVRIKRVAGAQAAGQGALDQAVKGIVAVANDRVVLVLGDDAAPLVTPATLQKTRALENASLVNGAKYFNWHGALAFRNLPDRKPQPTWMKVKFARRNPMQQLCERPKLYSFNHSFAYKVSLVWCGLPWAFRNCF